MAPSQALCEERMDRIEKTLELMQQKVEALNLENRQLKEKMQLLEAAAKQRNNISDTAITPVKVMEPVQEAADESFNMDVFQERIRDLEAGHEEVTTRLDSGVKVGGYASVEYGLTDKQTRNSGFRLHHFSLFFSKAIQKNWQLFSEVEFEDAPLIQVNPNNNGSSTVQGKFLVEQMYMKYHPSVRWDIVAGRFLTPFGVWNVYHYAPYVPTQRRPLMIRSLFPVFSDGLQLRYTFDSGLGLINSQFYVANGAGNPGRRDLNISKAVGGKINISPYFLEDLNVGASIYRDKDNLNVIGTTFGLHLVGHYHNAGIQAALAYRENNPLNAISFKSISTYTQLSYDVDRWTLAARYDWLNANSQQPLSNQYRYTGAVNYHFWHNVIGKVEYNYNRFDNPVIKNFQEVILSLAVAIGDF